MTPDEITNALTNLFGALAQRLEPEAWQVETTNFRLLVLLSEDHTWLRVLLPIAPAQEAQAFMPQLLEANFDATQETRYALHQDVLWGVFQHRLESLAIADLTAAIQRLQSLHEQGLAKPFNDLVEVQIRQIIHVAKLQGQSLEATLQTLNRFYEEGLMGDLEQGASSREEVLAAWKRQLERLWPEVES
ncbi:MULTISPECIES: hypothetical protein [Trichocoleus]|uniref:Uncharacterized protein n=1 Tax=Trichocoleus desertorum GB2-A4 TaxID=2933944 RepID=A0ABV0J875_9CYAN|nr:hypothetical protein [Trichocoleus sp. FACHB-46]MBD1860984.1 hypothetical protein [Trichocoleus sp. FACHB-46]